MKCYLEKNRDKIEAAILDLNLEQSREVGRNGSGSLENVYDGVPIVGGYLVKHKKKVIGWGVAFDKPYQKQTHIFIDPKHRKNGLGSRLVKRAKKDFPEYRFVPWNQYTTNFYDKLKAPTIYHR